jgi:hypothetical protein
MQMQINYFKNLILVHWNTVPCPVFGNIRLLTIITGEKLIKEMRLNKIRENFASFQLFKVDVIVM